MTDDRRAAALERVRRAVARITTDDEARAATRMLREATARARRSRLRVLPTLEDDG